MSPNSFVKTEESEKIKNEISFNCDQTILSLKILGWIESVFRTKNGTPRQSILAPNSKAKLKLLLPNNAGHLLDGLEDYSHCWIIFLFNFQTNKKTNYKIKPPRLETKSIGALGTRSPHRPNPIGLSLACIESVDHKKAIVHFSGIDLVHGTPVLDIKPYITKFDSPLKSIEPKWLEDKLLPENFRIIIEEKVKNKLCQLIQNNELDFYSNEEEVIELITNILKSEPRGRYRRKQHSNNQNLIYQFPVDNCVVCCQYNKENDSVIVFDIEKWHSGWNCRLTKCTNN